jgi:hypothetical protein
VYSVFAGVELPEGSSVTVDPPWGLLAGDRVSCSSQLEQCASFPAGVSGMRMVLAPVGAFGTNLRVSLSQTTCP